MKPRLTHLNQELELRESPHLRQEESRCPSTCQCIGGGGPGRSPDQSSSSVRIYASHLGASIWTQRRDPRNIETDPRLKVRVQLGVVQHLTFRVPGSWSQVGGRERGMGMRGSECSHESERTAVRMSCLSVAHPTMRRS